MIYPARIIDDEGVTWWDGFLAVPITHLHISTSKLTKSDGEFDILIQDVEAVLERTLGVEDGGPLYIYRLLRFK